MARPGPADRTAASGRVRAVTLFGVAVVGILAVMVFFQRGYIRSALVWLGAPVLRLEGDAAARRDAGKSLAQVLAERGLAPGAPVYLRLFKSEGVLEVWMQEGERFIPLRSYPICRWSGTLGPKLKEGDGQSPEGFYRISSRQLNPNSAYHLAFNLGFPNAYDRAHGRTGSYLMVHGSCVSIGCYAMTNGGIDEIYGLVAAALRHGQKAVAVDIFPFRMTDAAMARHAAHPWIGFWRNLKEGHDRFEATGRPPNAAVCGKRYDFSARTGSGCRPIAAW